MTEKELSTELLKIVQNSLRLLKKLNILIS